MKRITDITFSLIALIIALSIMLLVALAIKLESRGPVSYGSFRAGKEYKIFRLLKFRTMYSGVDKSLNILQRLNQYRKPEVATEDHDCEIEGCVKLVDPEANLVCEKGNRQKREPASYKIQNDQKGRLIVHTILKYIDETLMSLNSFKVHRSYILNLSKIVNIRDSNLVLKDKLIPISRSNKTSLMNSIRKL